MNPHTTDEEYREAARADQAAMELRETERAFEEVRKGLFEVIATSTLGETNLRERCFLAVQSLDKVRAILTEVASSRAMVEHSTLIRSIMSDQDAG